MTRALTILTGLVLSLGQGESAERQRRFGEETEAAMARIERIEAEIEQLREHPWAGRYYYGDGLGVNVTLYAAPGAGLVYRWTGCLGLYDLNHGRVVYVRDGRMRVELEIDTALNVGWGGARRYMSPELLVFRWGGRRYLVPECRAMELVNAINSGRRWSADRFPIRGAGPYRAGDERPAGLPRLPEPYVDYLLHEPVTARVTDVRELERVGESNGLAFLELTVSLDAGAERGLVEGMDVYSLDTRRPISAGVFDVGPRASSATFRFTSRELGDTRLRPGARLSTRSPQR